MIDGVAGVSRRFSRGTWIFAILSFLISEGAAYALFRAHSPSDLYHLPFFVGPGAESLLTHHNLDVFGITGTNGNEILFRSARMPIAAGFVALCAFFFGVHATLGTLLLKAALSWAVIFGSAVLALRWLSRQNLELGLYVLLLLVPFLIPAFLADVSNVSVEEGYSFCFLPLATALVFFLPRSRASVGWMLLLAGILDLLYLSKSSMLAAVFILTLGALYVFRGALGRVLLVVLVLAAPLSWSAYQHHASGRWTFGTSMDQVNFHKGNNEFFLQNYPPREGHTLDENDDEVNHGRMFSDEWAYSDWHRTAARAFIQAHPEATAVGVWRKFGIFFFSLTDYGSSNHFPRMITLFGLLLFRVELWGAIALAIYTLVVSRLRQWFEASLFLALVAACALPYPAGFAYIRHASVLIFPCSLLLCRLLPDVLRDQRKAGQDADHAAA